MQKILGNYLEIIIVAVFVIPILLFMIFTVCASFEKYSPEITSKEWATVKNTTNEDIVSLSEILFSDPFGTINIFIYTICVIGAIIGYKFYKI